MPAGYRIQKQSGNFKKLRSSIKFVKLELESNEAFRYQQTYPFKNSSGILWLQISDFAKYHNTELGIYLTLLDENENYLGHVYGSLEQIRNYLNA